MFRHAVLILPLALVSLNGCHDDVVLDEVRKRPDGPWSRAVKRISTRQGVLLNELSQHQDTLEAYLGWASTHGQHSNSWGESKEDRRLAYLLNVHNAAVLHNLLRHDLPESPDAVTFGLFQWPGAGFYWGTRYRIDKEWTGLAHMASHDTVSRYQEPLLWFGLYDGTQDSPRLRWWSREKKKLQPQLKRAARSFINSDRGMKRTADGWQVNPLFIAHERDFTDWTEASTLCEWMASYARGERKTWLESQGEDCELSQWTPRRGTDRAMASPPSAG